MEFAGLRPVVRLFRSPHFVKRLLAPLTSLRLTVTLLALGIAVVFFGTLAQTEDGLYVAQSRYFRSWFSTWSPHTPSLKWIIIPLPGGYLLGTALLVNLIAAHIARFKFSWKKSGILISHLGIIVLLVGQLATDMFARESRMSFAEGEWRNYSEDFQETELVFLSDTSDAAMHSVVAIPESLLKTGENFVLPVLPFTFKVRQWIANSDPVFVPPMMAQTNAPQTSHGIGRVFTFTEVPVTRKMDDKNVPSALLEIASTNGTSLGTWAVSDWAGEPSLRPGAMRFWVRSFSGATSEQQMAEAMEQYFPMTRPIYSKLIEPQSVTVDGRKYSFLLRPRRYYQPFSVQLLKTTHEVYAGTADGPGGEGIPKNFQSRVLVDHPTKGRREVDIYMNNPLRYEGLTFFQYQMGRDEIAANRGTSTFQVVKNPSWLTPYLGCVLVSLGLLVQFGIHLGAFLSKPRNAAAAAAAASASTSSTSRR